MLAHNVVEHALESGGVDAFTPPAVAVGDLDLIVLTSQDRLTSPRRQGAPGGVDVEGELLAQGLKLAGEVLLVARPGGDGPLGQGELLIGDDELGVHLEPGADSGAGGAGAVGGVEGEGARLHLVQGQGVLVGAGALLGVAPFPVGVVLGQVDQLDDDQPLRQPQRRLHRVGEALADALADDEPVDDDLDVVLEALVEGRGVVEALGGAVDAHPVEAASAQLAEELGVLTLAAPHHRGENLEASTLGQGADLVHDLLRGLGGDDGVTDRAVLDAGPRVEQTQVVVDLCHGAHRGPGVARGGLLVDGHRRAQALDELDVGFVHLPEELTGVGGQGLHVAALPLGEDRVEGEGGLARARQSGEDDHRVARQVQVYALEIVLAGPTDDERVVHGIRV